MPEASLSPNTISYAPTVISSEMGIKNMKLPTIKCILYKWDQHPRSNNPNIQVFSEAHCLLRLTCKI